MNTEINKIHSVSERSKYESTKKRIYEKTNLRKTESTN